MIYIKELLPNPVGRDADGEWIKLTNQGQELVNLSGWKISDKSGKAFGLNGKQILPREELKLDFKETKIPLNNDGDTITLYNAHQELVDELSYNEVAEEEVILADRFREVKSEEPQLASAANQALLKEAITNTYEVWPLFVGIFIAVAAGFIGSYISKKVHTCPRCE